MRTKTAGGWRAAMAAVLMAAGAVGAEMLDMKGFVAGPDRPATMKLGDLDAGWTRLELQGGQDARGNPLAFLGGQGGDDVLFTRGESVAMGTETFLVVYRMPPRPVNARNFQRRTGGGAAAPAPAPAPAVSAETELRMTIVNLRAIQGIADARPFDLQREIEESTSAATAAEDARTRISEAIRQFMEGRGAGGGGTRGTRGGRGRTGGGGGTTEENLQRLGQAVRVWAEENGNQLPAMPNTDAAKSVLRAFVTGDDTWTQPGTQEAYAVNPWISEKKLEEVDAAKTVVFYEFQPDQQGTRSVVYLDGRVERISGADWTAIQEAQNLP